jgi:hypothetical protein
VSFFEGLELPAWDEPEEEPHESPEWLEAPRGWLGGVVPLELLVARSHLAAVYLSSLVAYPTGFTLTINTLASSADTIGLDAFEPYHLQRRRRSEGGEIPPELLRFGVQYSDGRKKATFGEWLGGGISSTMLAFSGEDDAPDPSTQIVIESGGGRGGALDADQKYWIWPLPPPGPVTFACEWPELEIPETQVAMEGEVIRKAAGRAERVWPPDGEGV